MRKFLLFIIAIFVIAFISNPNESDHQRAFKNATNPSGNEVADFIGYVVSKKVVRRDNMVFFSLTKLRHFGGEETTVGIGAFGTVYIFGQH
jgi:hypothetical protein